MVSVTAATLFVVTTVVTSCCLSTEPLIVWNVEQNATDRNLLPSISRRTDNSYMPLWRRDVGKAAGLRPSSSTYTRSTPLMRARSSLPAKTRTTHTLSRRGLRLVGTKTKLPAPSSDRA